MNIGLEERKGRRKKEGYYNCIVRLLSGGQYRDTEIQRCRDVEM